MTQTIEQIDDLMNDDRYAWAFHTLSDIRETISKTGIVTENQAEAINNVRNAVSRQQRDAITGEYPSARFTGSRRYEGFHEAKSDEKKFNRR